MNIFFLQPLPVRMLVVFVLAALAAGQVNRGIYRLAWNRRLIGPWSPPHPWVPGRRWYDRVPILGWYTLRREAAVHGNGYWVRPLLIEFSAAVGLTALYWYEMQGGLLPLGAISPGPAVLHAQFLSHFLLIQLMLVATFIDVDEKTIPDEVTVPGTLLGMTLASCLPISLLPAWLPQPPPLTVQPLLITAPDDWPLWLDGVGGLLIGLLCCAAWCYALLPKTLWYRGGWQKFGRYLLASIRRHPHTPVILLIGLIACLGHLAAWLAGPAWWRGLLTATVGMAVGGAIVWGVRVIAGPILGQEAMGFGDVTLMGMIGAFLGWQAALLVFFLAPFTGALIAVGQWLLTGRKDIAFGPFLCLAALLLLLIWPAAWARWALPLFWLGWLLPAIIVFCLVLLAGMLLVVQSFKRLFLTA